MKTSGLLTLLAFGLLLTGCYVGPGVDRAARLTNMAAAEAANVSNPKDRLTRQLNIAHVQIRQGWYKDARANLDAARKTIEASDHDQLDNLARIAGWVSVSELSRRAHDEPAASFACDQALSVLNAITPLSQRCEYVRGLADEVDALRGKAEAAKLLRQAGPWAKTIQDMQYRRTALAAIAHDLFVRDDYDGGRDVLKQEDDPSWRSDTLLALANQSLPYQSLKFGKSVTFETNYLMQSAR
jgi:hypothetical protein